MIRTFRYRIYPTQRQVETLNHHLAICCELYNAGLQERREAWKLERKSISLYDQINQLPGIRAIREDVACVYSQSLQEPLQRVDRGFKAFFRRVQNGQNGQKPGYPRFRSPLRYDTLAFRDYAAKAPSGGKVRIPKVGHIKIKQHREMVGVVRTLTIKRAAGGWFAVFSCEVRPNPLPFSPNMVGVDVGLTHFATLSDGTQIDNPRYYRKAERALRVAQRRVARRKKGSKRRRKATEALQRVHIYIRQQRADFLHKQSRALVNVNGLIAAEKLNIKGMVRSNLAKSIHDAAWGIFLNMIAYKAEYAGRVFVQVNPRGTSQTCTCGAAVRKTLADRWHSCLDCGLSLPRDHVSAQVVLSRAGVQPSSLNVGDLMPCVA